jgi:hypothetical protein
MAVNEGIRSPFSAQPSARSPKLRIYESLFLLNQGVDQVVATLRGMRKFPFVRKDALQCAQDEIEEVRAGMNADFIEELAPRERDDEGRFWKQRRTYEKKLEDPDDAYLSVKEREEERQKRGLPPRIGILPHSVVAEEERGWEGQQERKKKATRHAPTANEETYTRPPKTQQSSTSDTKGVARGKTGKGASR